jgi:3-dehydroquinate synthase/shikimate kinase/3-dehydroquinate synthase
LLANNFNRSDIIISVGGGITGDVTGFVASIFKRGINFINIPTTLLAQVDSAIGGKTGVNSSYGKNLIGSFYQPRLVISDTDFINTLPKKEMISGFAEILKHSIIKDKNFFSWLEKNTKSVLAKKAEELIYAIKKSCEIKIHFVNQDVNEKGMRMILNFGHTFAHAIEVKNNYSKSTTHGEAVLSGMILATRLSVIKKICSPKTLSQIKNIYIKNDLSFAYKKYSHPSSINKLIPYLKNDKKNNDDKINFILLKNIGKTALPNTSKISIKNLKNISKTISQY